MQELASPCGVAADSSLRRFQQKKAQNRVALFADVSQPLPAGTGVFAGDQSQVAADLLVATKTFR
jgi:hypothetical protein